MEQRRVFPEAGVVGVDGNKMRLCLVIMMMTPASYSTSDDDTDVDGDKTFNRLQ